MRTTLTLQNLAKGRMRGHWMSAAILSLGVILRVIVWAANPPNNCLDDHLEPIAKYAIEGWRPNPKSCWQCYQPPVYYVVSATVLRATTYLTDHAMAAATSSRARRVIEWKAVQAVSALASVGTMMLTHLILWLWYPSDRHLCRLALLILAILPVDIYAAGFIGNDAMLVCWSTLAVAGYSVLARTARLWTGTALLLGGTILAVWTKQSGAVTLLLPCVVLLRLVLHKMRLCRISFLRSKQMPVLVCVLVTLPIAMSDEIWRAGKTGMFLFSNQHVFRYADDQPPRTFDKVSLASFRLVSLMKEPVMSDATLASLPTELFARTWFDYEPRYLPSSRLTKWFARLLYLLGLPFVLLTAVGAAQGLKRSLREPAILPLLLLLVGFLAVPFLQTSRFPHFSSMKAVFVLPAVSIAAMMLVLGLRLLPGRFSQTFISAAMIIILLIGIGHVALIVALRKQHPAEMPVLLGGRKYLVPRWPMPGL